MVNTNSFSKEKKIENFFLWSLRKERIVEGLKTNEQPQKFVVAGKDF